MLMANIGRVKYPPYAVNRERAVFPDREALVRWVGDAALVCSYNYCFVKFLKGWSSKYFWSPKYCVNSCTVAVHLNMYNVLNCISYKILNLNKFDQNFLNFAEGVNVFISLFDLVLNCALC